MKTLLVLRHAKASQDSASGSDFDRPLTSRGRRQALAVGVELGGRGRAVDAIVASPAARVCETVDGLMTGAGWNLAPLWERQLYGASLDTLLDVVQAIDDRLGEVLLVGHNPGLKLLLAHLSEEDDGGLRARVSESFPTASCAELRLPVETWRKAGARSGRIVGLVRPDCP